MIQHIYPEEKYLWKFFDLYKFISFLRTKEIIFSRLDQFEDAMEGCSEEMANLLTNELHIAESSRSQKKSDLNPELYDETGHEFLKKLNTLKNMQRTIYASCFYASNEESIAMWKLYAGVQGVAIRFHSYELYKNMRQVHSQVLGDKMDLGGNKMDYINLLNTNHYKEDGSIKKLNQSYSPYNKDVSYKHEDEYRFILVSHTPSILDTEVKTLKIDLDEGYFDFIVSPDTENWKKELLNQLIRENGFNKVVKSSDIVTREVLSKHKLKFLDNLLENEVLSGRRITLFYK